MFAKLKSIFGVDSVSEKKIIFWSDDVTDYPAPVPAASAIPEWWRKTKSYGAFKSYSKTDEKEINVNSGADNATIKRCVPVLDSMSMGYLVLTPADMYVEPKHVHTTGNKDEPTQDFSMVYPRRHERIDHHPWGQASKHPYATQQPLAKVFVPWRVALPEGYSLIMTEPLNNPSPHWSVVSGVMDSDVFFPRLNFMISMKEEKFTGIVPMETPIAQLIPFKREKWSSVVIDDAARLSVQEEPRKKIIDSRLAKVFSGAYKKFFWSRKDFR
jgi:hypothetical protein